MEKKNLASKIGYERRQVEEKRERVRPREKEKKNRNKKGIMLIFEP